MKNSLTKKTLSIILSLIMIITALPLTAVTSFALTSGDWEYTVENGKATITGYNGSDFWVTIPSQLDGYNVTALGASVFNGNADLESVTIPNGITSIGSLAFSACSLLSSITIPCSVTDIGASAFSGCESLCEAIIPSSVTSIGAGAFDNCWSLSDLTLYYNPATDYSSIKYIVAKIIVSDGVVSIGDSAFCGWYNCYSISLPDSLISIGNYAFCGCNIGNLTIPNNVTSIGNYAFSDCYSLSSVSIPRNVTYIGDYAFDSGVKISGYPGTEAEVYATNNGNQFISLAKPLKFKYTLNDANEITITGYEGEDFDSVEIPSVIDGYNVKRIGDGAFSGCTRMTSLVIPDGVTSLGNSAFYNCSYLESITIPNTVTSLGSSVFYGCINLKSVTIPDGVTSIENRAFYNCASLESATIPNTVTSLGESAFCGCTLLSEIAIPNGVTSIEGSTFYNCSSLESVTIPNCVTSIGNSAFYNCSSLESVTIPNMVTSIGYSAFSECTSLNEIAIPDGVTSIGDSAFYNGSSLENVTIPSTVTSIGYSAFYGCSETANITVYYNTTVDYARLVPNVTSFVVPEDVSELDYSSFCDYSSLKEIIVDESNVSYSSYEGMLFNKDGTELLCCPTNYNFEEVIIPESVTSIHANAFRWCNSIASVTIPDSVKSIGYYAFNGCTSLKNVTIGSGISTISNAFYSCNSIENVTIHYNPLCSYSPVSDKVKEVVVPVDVITIPSNAFFQFYELSKVYISESVQIIGDGAFAHCYKLKEIEISENNQYYCSKDNVVFSKDMTSLIFYAKTKTDKNYIVPKTITKIEDDAFSYCEYLDNLVVPDSVTNFNYTVYGDEKIIDRLICYKGSYADTYAKGNSFISGKIHYLGDVDSNGEIDLSDYNLIISHLESNGESFNEITTIVADYDMDGAVDAFDMFYVDKVINQSV